MIIDMTKTDVIKPGESSLPDPFPFTIQDLKYWIVKRKDGLVCRYVMRNEQTYKTAYPGPGQVVGPHGGAPYSNMQDWGTTHLSDYCKHKGEKVIWSNKKVELHIADALGFKDEFVKYDTGIDCGHAITIGGWESLNTLQGSGWLVEALDKHVEYSAPNYLQIDWTDREAPDLAPEFWIDLSKLLEGSVLVCCQGGHGRSGTAMVCLMMCYEPTYTPYDAICHLRALHCGRAIESKVQHDYINEVGTYLGREANAHSVEGVKDFREAFLAIDKPAAKVYQERLKKEKK